MAIIQQEKAQSRTRVFVSYSRKDSVFVDSLLQELIAAGYEAFLDRRDIAGGENWRARLDSLILTADAVLFVVTDASLASEIVSWEINRTVELGKRLVPLAHGRPTCPPPEALGSLNYIFSDAPGFGETLPSVPSAEALSQVFRAIDVDIAWVREHARLVSRAVEWEMAPEGLNRNSKLLRLGEVEAAQGWMQLRPDHADVPRIPDALKSYIEVSANHELTSRNRLLTITGRAFVKPAEQALADGRYDRALRFAVAGALLADDPHFTRVPELSSVVTSAIGANPHFYTFRHGGSIKGAVFTHDETRILTWSEDCTARLWDAVTGQQIGPELRHEGPVNGAKFSQDETRVFTWSEDSSIRVWDAKTGAQIGQDLIMEEPLEDSAGVDGVILSEDESRLLSWNIYGGQLWDTKTGEEIGPNLDHEGLVNGASFSKDETRIITWGMDVSDETGTIRIWDAETGQQVGSELKHEGAVTGAMFSSGGTLVLSWGDDGAVKIWDSKNSQQIGADFRLEHEHWDPVGVGGATFSKDETRILAWNIHAIRIWDARSGTEIGQDRTPWNVISGAVFSNDETIILSWCQQRLEENGTLDIWDAATGHRLWPDVQHLHGINGATFSKDQTRILSWGVDGTVRLWDAKNGEQIGPTFMHEKSVTGAVFSGNDTRILSWSYDNTARIWDAATGQQIGPGFAHVNTSRGAAFLNDQKRILSWGLDHTARVWDAVSGHVEVEFRHESVVKGAVTSMDESCILTWSADNTARLWNSASGRQVGPNLTHGSSVNGAAFSKDETRILSWSEDGAVRLWDTSTGQQIGHDFLLMDEHESWYEVGIKGACLSRDETRILSWDTDRAHLWDSWTGQHIWSASNWVKGAAFLSDESHILTWSGDNSVHLYDAATGGQIGSSLELDGSIDGTVTFKGEVSVLTWKGGVARLWDVKTGQQIGPEFRHEGPGSPVVFSKDEHRILTGCVDTARLWDIETGRQIGADFKLQGPVKGATFSKDETRILTWSVYGVRLWDTSRNLVARTNVSSLICAAIGGGLGVLSDEDKRDLLLSEAPHDLFAAFAEKLTADQKEILPRVSAGLRAQLHPTCYLPPSVRDPTIASTLLPKESTPQIVAPNKNWAIYLLVLAISIAGALGLIALFWPVGAIDLPELRHLF